MLAIFVLLFSLPSVVLSEDLKKFETSALPPDAIGAFSLAFDKINEFVTVISDGRLVKFVKKTNGFVDFATTVPTRSKAECDGRPEPRPTCGRPLNVDYYKKDDIYYLTDQFRRGLLVVGRNGGLATEVPINGSFGPLRLISALVIDQRKRVVYFSQATSLTGPLSTRPLEEALEMIPPSDMTGRVLKYDQSTGVVTVLLTGLNAPSGLAISQDGKYLLISEYRGMRILKSKLDGSQSAPQVLINLGGRPLHIKRYVGNYFLVPLSFIVVTGGPGPTPPRRVEITARFIIFNGLNGKIVKSYDLSPFYKNTTVTEVEKIGGKFYFGTFRAPFVGRADG